jgi:hypothetical protein
MEEMTREMETDLHCKAIMVLMNMLGLTELTVNGDQVKAAGRGEDFMNLRMAIDIEKKLLTLRIEPVLE